jgi:tetratricopeptide (TPR) repeat protein
MPSSAQRIRRLDGISARVDNVAPTGGEEANMDQTKRVDWRTIDVPQDVSAVPAMLENEERQYLIWVTAVPFEGFGAVVDLGPWLGGSSVAMAHGLRLRGKPGRVQSYDLFAWEPAYMSSLATDLRQGDDFQPLFRKVTAAYADRIDAQRMDLMQGSWNGGPIEILFVDAAKSWGLWREILRVFGPHLVPGRSRVVHQDFRHSACPWLPLTCDAHPEVWRQAEAVDVGSTVTFIPQCPLRPEDADRLVRQDLPYAQRIELLQRRLQIDLPAQAWRYRLMIAVEAAREGDHDRLRDLRPQLANDGATHEQAARDIPLLLHYAILQRGWQRVHERDFAGALAVVDEVPVTSPVAYDALVLAGNASRAASRFARAEAALGSAVALAPDRPDARLEFLWLRLAQSRFAEGELAAREFLSSQRPVDAARDASALRALCHMLAHQGRLEEALAENDRVLALVNEPETRVDRADLLDRLGRRNEAAAACREILQQWPGHARAKDLLQRVTAAAK